MVVTKRCRGCIYFGANDRHGVYSSCDYLLRTGKRRGCPAGDACDKFRPQIDSVSLTNPTGRVIRIAATEDQLLALYDQGLSDAEIASAVGAGKKAVFRWRIKRGLPSRQALLRSVDEDED